MPKKKNAALPSRQRIPKYASLLDKAVALLRNYRGRYLSIRELSFSLGVSEERLRRGMDRFNREAYRIEVHPFLGVRYLQGPLRPNPNAVKVLIRGSKIGREIYLLETVGSTNDVAFGLADRGFPHGTVVIAAEQTAGRGRFGRSWDSRKGKGLWFSVVLRPPSPLPLAGGLTVSFSLAAAFTLEKALNLTPQIRWPNDVLVGGKKVVGILLEGKNFSSKNGVLVLGVGVNVHHRRYDFPPSLRGSATSLFLEGARVEDEEGLTAMFLKSIQCWYHHALKGDLRRIEKEVKKRSFILGKRIRLGYRGANYVGTVEDIRIDEGLCVRIPEGGLRFFPGDHTQVLEIFE